MPSQPLSLPHSEDCEKGLLCSLWLNPNIFDLANLDENLFYIPANRLIFRALLECYQDEGTTDFFIVKRSFTANELLEVGDIQYLDEVYTFIPSSSNWRAYAEDIIDLFHRRTVWQACHILGEKMLDIHTARSESIREIAEKGLVHIANMTAQYTEAKLKQVLIEEYGKVVDHRETRAYVEATGIRALDLAMGGLLPGDQIVIGAETSFGKTSLALNIACHVALGEQRKKVAIFSFEMSRTDICHRIMASRAQIPCRGFRYGNLSDEEQHDAKEWLETVPKDRTIVIENGCALDIAGIVSRCRRLKVTGELDMVIVDYLQLVNPAITKESNRQREIADISRRLKVMAGELGVVVIALSQLNDQGQLRESRAIGQDADIVLIIKEPSSSDPSQKEILIWKARNGPHGQKIPVHFHTDYVTFQDNP